MQDYIKLLNEVEDFLSKNVVLKYKSGAYRIKCRACGIRESENDKGEMRINHKDDCLLIKVKQALKEATNANDSKKGIIVDYAYFTQKPSKFNDIVTLMRGWFQSEEHFAQFKKDKNRDYPCVSGEVIIARNVFTDCPFIRERFIEWCVEKFSV